MPAKPVPKSEKTAVVTLKSTAATAHTPGVTPATIAPGSDAKDSLYDAVAKDLTSIGASDAAAKKIQSGPLGEGRGQDVIRLHATLKAVDLLNGKVNRVYASLQTAMADLDSHLHTDASSLTTQADRQSASILKTIKDAQADLNSALDQAHTALTSSVQKAHTAVSDQLTKSTASLTKSVESAHGKLSSQLNEAQSALSGEVAEALSDLQGRNDTLLDTVKDSFTKLSRATAGSEENLRAQTDSFSNAVEELMNTVQNNLQKQIFEFREETTRQVDKRMNQSDVAFAAVRADQEVIKALLTDIIKDRMGRAEPKYR
jgi:F0F1-type ATP synthase membrane subunit b/b'